MSNENATVEVSIRITQPNGDYRIAKSKVSDEEPFLALGLDQALGGIINAPHKRLMMLAVLVDWTGDDYIPARDNDTNPSILETADAFIQAAIKYHCAFSNIK